MPMQLIGNRADMTMSSMYCSGEDGEYCGKCTVTTSQCRGHCGIIEAVPQHVSYIYRSQSQRVLRSLCDNCHLPLRNPPTSWSVEATVTHMHILRVYRGATCLCTGTKEKVTRRLLVNKLVSFYETVEQSDQQQYVLKHLGMGTRREVLHDYVIVPPMHLLEQIPNGGYIAKRFLRLIESCHNRRIADIVYCNIVDLFESIENSLKDKRGVFRQLLVPRKLFNSARGVIISDVNIPINWISVPRVIAKSISTKVVVDATNLQYCLDNIYSGNVSYVKYANKKHRLLSNNVTVTVSNTRGVVNIVAGSELILDGIRVTLNTHRIVVTMEQLRVATMAILVLREGYVEITAPREYVLYVETISRDTRRRVVPLPLQHGAIVPIAQNGQKLIVHRNPVLSADCIYFHNMYVVDNVDSVSISEVEKQKQRYAMDNKKILMRLSDKESTSHTVKLSGFDDVIEGRLVPSSNRHRLVYVIVSRDASEYNIHRDSNCTLGINPCVTDTYHADFDGDEMNVAYLDDEKGKLNKSIVSAMSLGKVGIAGDALYGLHCLVRDKVNVFDIVPNYNAHTAPYPVHADTRALRDWGLSKSNAMYISTLSDTVNDAHRVIATLVRGTVFSSHYVVHMFLVRIRLDTNRRMYKDRDALSQLFMSFVSNESNANELRGTYSYDNDEDIVGAFYADLSLALCRICDYCGIVFDRTDATSIEAVMRSKCRPKQGTYDSIYKQIGVSSYTKPDNVVHISHISSNYSTGVSSTEFEKLCYSNRAQSVVKALDTAPEGDNMRLRCNFVSPAHREQSTWFYKTMPLCELVEESSVYDVKEDEYLSTERTYTEILDYSAHRLKYRPANQMQKHLLDASLNVIRYGQRKLLMCEIESTLR